MVGVFLKTFEEFPPRQRPASFSIDQAVEKARAQQEALASGSHQVIEGEGADTAVAATHPTD